MFLSSTHLQWGGQIIFNFFISNTYPIPRHNKVEEFFVLLLESFHSSSMCSDYGAQSYKLWPVTAKYTPFGPLACYTTKILRDCSRFIMNSLIVGFQLNE
jgi:hypothetical protein